MRILLSTALMAVLLLKLAGSVAMGEGRLNIVAAENFYGEVAREIGGDMVAVTVILSNPDADPHLYESTPSTARAVAEADIVIHNGAGYDRWMERLLAATDSAGRAVISAAQLAGVENGANPHVWYDPGALPAVARALAGELARRDPAHADSYRANLAAFENAFATVRSQIQTIRSRHAGTRVTATEPLFGYMADALGFRMLNEDFQTAMMNETEPGPREVAAFEKSLRDGSVRILFYNNQVRDRTTERLLDLAKEAGVSVVGVSETMPAELSIEAWLGGELEAVAQALETTN